MSAKCVHSGWCCSFLRENRKQRPFLSFSLRVVVELGVPFVMSCREGHSCFHQVGDHYANQVLAPPPVTTMILPPLAESYTYVPQQALNKGLKVYLPTSSDLLRFSWLAAHKRLLLLLGSL